LYTNLNGAPAPPATGLPAGNCGYPAARKERTMAKNGNKKKKGKKKGGKKGKKKKK
jgi:hypothetical protein